MVQYQAGLRKKKINSHSNSSLPSGSMKPIIQHRKSLSHVRHGTHKVLVRTDYIKHRKEHMVQHLHSKLYHISYLTISKMSQPVTVCQTPATTFIKFWDTVWNKKKKKRFCGQSLFMLCLCRLVSIWLTDGLFFLPSFSSVPFPPLCISEDHYCSLNVRWFQRLISQLVILLLVLFRKTLRILGETVTGESGHQGVGLVVLYSISTSYLISVSWLYIILLATMSFILINGESR